MNSKIEEVQFLIGAFSQLRTYKDHNQSEIDYVLSILKYRLYELETACVSKYESNLKKKCSRTEE